MIFWVLNRQPNLLAALFLCCQSNRLFFRHVPLYRFSIIFGFAMFWRLPTDFSKFVSVSIHWRRFVSRLIVGKDMTPFVRRTLLWYGTLNDFWVPRGTRNSKCTSILTQKQSNNGVHQRERSTTASWASWWEKLMNGRRGRVHFFLHFVENQSVLMSQTTGD